MSRIVGLNDLKKKEEKGKDNKKQSQLFAGGLDQRGGGSGVNVLGPPQGDDDDDDDDGNKDDSLFGQIQRSATRSGAVSESGTAGSRKITIYKNGFTVDDGPLRDPHSDENRQFISDLGRGLVPREFGVGEVDVSLVDKHEEEYVPPPYSAFSGGNVLGSSLPADAALVVDEGLLFALPAAPEPVSGDRPATTIMVRTLDGRKLKIRINTDATILQLITAIKCEFSSRDSYVLCSGFPPVDISDASATIEQQGLANTLVTMRKVDG